MTRDLSDILTVTSVTYEFVMRPSVIVQRGLNNIHPPLRLRGPIFCRVQIDKIYRKYVTICCVQNNVQSCKQLNKIVGQVAKVI